MFNIAPHGAASRRRVLAIPQQCIVVSVSHKTAKMVKASVFKSKKSEALRSPKSAALTDGSQRVDVIAVGTAKNFAPENMSWAEWFDGTSIIDDFMAERNQPAEQSRDSF